MLHIVSDSPVLPGVHEMADVCTYIPMSQRKRRVETQGVIAKFVKQLKVHEFMRFCRG